MAYRYRDVKEGKSKNESSGPSTGDKIAETTATAPVEFGKRTGVDGSCGVPREVEPEKKTLNADFVWNATLASQVFLCGSFNR